MSAMNTFLSRRATSEESDFADWYRSLPKTERTSELFFAARESDSSLSSGRLSEWRDVASAIRVTENS